MDRRTVRRLTAALSAFITLAAVGEQAAAAGCSLPPTPSADRIPLMQLSMSKPEDREAHGARISLLWTDQEYRPRIPGVYAMKYIMADRDPGRDHDTNWALANHPDWVARKCGGDPAQEFKYSFGYFTPLDIKNTSVRNYLLDRDLGKVIKSKRFDAVSVDNLSADNNWGRCGVLTPSGFRKDFTGTPVDPAYTAALADWMIWLKSKVNAAGLCLAGNDYFSDNNPQGFLQLARALDIVVDEHGFTRKGRPLSLDAVWRNRLDAYEQVAASRPLVIIDYPADTLDSLTNAGLSWSLANYLLIKGPNTYLSLTTADGSDKWKAIPALDIPIGVALSGIRQAGGLYARQFQHVLVIVNASSTTQAGMALPSGNWRDLDGKMYQGQAALGPASALVLSAVR